MIKNAPQDNANTINIALESLQYLGYAIIQDVFTKDFMLKIKSAMYETHSKIVLEIGKDRLSRAGELGVSRNMFKYNPLFFKFLENPLILSIIKQTVSETAILHLQNGFILPSYTPQNTPTVFQNSFHQDFPRVLNGYLASINILIAIDEFTENNGATLAVPGTHQRNCKPTNDYMNQFALPITCPSGSIVIFDSTLWHAAGRNTSGHDRLAINHQFTRSYIKQQIDYVRALGDVTISTLSPRTQQLLGYYTRVVTSLDEYYQPQENRLYRKGQG